MRIVSTARLTPAQREVLLAAAPGAEVLDRQCESLEEIAQLVRGGCDVLVTFRVPHALGELAPRLRWLHLLTAGADQVAKDPASYQSIVVTTSSGIHCSAIAQYTLGSILTYVHRFHLTTRAQLSHTWLKRQPFMENVRELRGATIGIIGYGSLGREIARLARAFGMKVLALKRDPAQRADPGWFVPGTGDPLGVIPQRFFGPEQRAELLAQSDFIVVTLPLTPHTRAFIGAHELEATRPGAYLVNVGRGEVIDQAAMVRALQEKRLGGVGLDVFEREPLEAESPLWDFEHAILTPHVAGSFRGYLDRACELFAENLRRFTAGDPLLNQVDVALGY
jgi:phosphoglycerate dehydrogenase-like enzyme